MSALPSRLLGSLDGIPLYREQQDAGPDDNTATAQTVERMCRHIAGAVAHDPATQASAADALQRFGNVALSPLRRRAWSVWWYVKHRMKFVQDEKLLGSMLGEPPQRELMISPAILLRMKEPQGDCDDFTMLVCALLKCLNVPFEIVTIAADPTAPERWSHVYAVALVEDGQRIPIDASHGKFPGWEVPLEHILRYQAWDEIGEPIEGRAPAVRSQLNGYVPRGLGARRMFRRLAGGLRRGLGDDDGSDGSGGTDITGGAIDAWLNSLGSSDSFASTDAAATAEMNNFWNSMLGGSSNAAGSNLLGSEVSTVTQTLSQLIAPQATVTGPGGLNVSGPAGTVASIFGSGALSSSSSTLILLLIAGVVVFMVARK
jgi:hypothetical protein